MPFTRVVRQIVIDHVLFLTYVSKIQTAVDLKQMTLPDKLRLMEALWDEVA